MKKMQNMGGFFVAAVTPFDENGKFNAPALHKLMDKTIAEGANGFLDWQEAAQEWSAAQQCRREEGLAAASAYHDRAKTHLIASVAAISTEEAVAYAKTAKELGYDAMISTVPYYYKFGMKAIAEYYNTLREAVDLPLFLYNFPGNTGVELDLNDPPYPRYADGRNHRRREADQPEPVSDGAHPQSESGAGRLRRL